MNRPLRSRSRRKVREEERFCPCWVVHSKISALVMDYSRAKASTPDSVALNLAPLAPSKSFLRDYSCSQETGVYINLLKSWTYY
jgi:hypothetical protein